MSAAILSCFPVRRPSSGAFTPGSLGPTKLSAWYRAKTLTSLFTTVGGAVNTPDGGPVARWEDLSGNGKHLLQPTGASQPTRSDAAFAGGTGVVTDGNDLMVATSVVLDQTSMEVWTVMYMNGLSTQVFMETSANFLAAGSFNVLTDLGTDYFIWGNGNVGYTNCSKAGAAATGVLLRGVVDFTLPTDEATVYLGGVAGATRTFNSNNTGSFTTQDLYVFARVGPSFASLGRMGETCIINGSLTAPEQANMVAYFLAEWGL